MRTTKSLLFALFLVIGQFTFHAYADAIKTVGATGSDYPNLRLAFNEANSGVLTGAVELQIIDGTTEASTAFLTGTGGVASVTILSGGAGYAAAPAITFSAAPAGGVTATATSIATGGVLTSITITNPGCGYTSAPTITIAGGTTAATTTVNLGAPSYTSLKIYPTVTGKTITGSNAKALIMLNGANNVTFDGRLNQAGTERDLTVLNTSVGSGPMTIQLIGNASNNTFKYCKIKGLGQSTSSAMFTLSNPLTSSATGCANNTISNNIFSGTSAAVNARPFAVIYSVGVTGAINTGNIVQDNDFQDVFVNNGNTSCIALGNFNNGWTISGNSFYETASYTNAVSNSTYNYIAVGSGNSHTISGNYIGGTASHCGGGTFTKTTNTNNAFRGIYFSHTDVGTPSTIENNVIKNIAWSNGTTTATWNGIFLAGSHDVNVIGNTIGNVSVTNSAAGSNVIGIEKTNGTALRDIRNNFIYGLTSSAATTGQLFGIRITGGLTTVSNNIISLSTDNAVSIIGIYDNGSSGKTALWYFNTVQIGGSPITGTISSYGFWSNALSNTRDFRNNIFVNTRSNGGTASGSHYAAYFNYSASTSLTLDNNDYYVSGSGGVLGRYAGSNITTGSVMVTGKDAASVNVNTGFANPTGTAAVDFKPSNATLIGATGTGIVTDYSGATRNIPTMGAWEVAPSNDLPTLAATVAATSITASGASTGGEVTAIGTSAVLARGVCWSTTTGPTLPTTNKTEDGSGIGSFASTITGLSAGTKYYVRAYATNTTGTAYGEEMNFTTSDTEAPTAFTATKGAVGLTTVELLLNATDNSGSINYTISYGAGPTIVNTTGTSGVQKSQVITGLTEGTAYTFSVVAKDANLNEAAINPIEVAATTNSTTPVVAAPTPPERNSGDVISMFSNAYTNVPVNTWRTDWSSGGTLTELQIVGNDIKKYQNLTFVGIETTGANLIDATNMTHVHFDVWTPNVTSLKLKIVDFGANAIWNGVGQVDDKEHELTLSPTLSSWNTYDLSLAEFTNLTTNAHLAQYIFTASPVGIITIDNMYFYKSVATEIRDVNNAIGVACYPNPMLNQLTVSAKSEISQVIVRNLVGQSVKTVTVNGREKTIDLSTISSGNYFLTVKLADGQFTTQKIVKL